MLRVALGALMLDAAVELAFIIIMVAWLHNTASGTFPIAFRGTIFGLAGTPHDLLLDQGHTANGAAGTAFVLIGIGGALALWLRNGSLLGAIAYHIWLAANVLGLLLTLVALAYVFAVTTAHKGQAIDEVLAAALPAGERYPVGLWTPQNWFAAVLQLNLEDASVREDIIVHLNVMRGWQYNLIPMFLVQLGQTAMAILDYSRWRGEVRYSSAPAWNRI